MHLEEHREYDNGDYFSLDGGREHMMQIIMHESEQNQVTIDKRFNHFDQRCKTVNLSHLGGKINNSEL